MKSNTTLKTIKSLEPELEEARADIGMGELIGLGVVIIVLGFVVTLGAQMQSDVRADINQTSDPEAYTAATDSITATGKLASKQGLIVTAVVGIFLIGLFLLYLRFN